MVSKLIDLFLLIDISIVLTRHFNQNKFILATVILVFNM